MLQLYTLPGGRGQWKDAVTELEKLYTKFTKLQWLPVADEILVKSKRDAGKEEQMSMFDMAKAALVEYGWPDNFRRDDWRSDVAGLWGEWEADVNEEDAAQRGE